MNAFSEGEEVFAGRPPYFNCNTSDENYRAKVLKVLPASRRVTLSYEIQFYKPDPRTGDTESVVVPHQRGTRACVFEVPTRNIPVPTTTEPDSNPTISEADNASAVTAPTPILSPPSNPPTTETSALALTSPTAHQFNNPTSPPALPLVPITIPTSQYLTYNYKSTTLSDICKQLGLATTGRMLEKADRIVHHLNNDEFAVWNAPAIDKGRNALHSAEAAVVTAPTPILSPPSNPPTTETSALALTSPTAHQFNNPTSPPALPLVPITIPTSQYLTYNYKSTTLSDICKQLGLATTGRMLEKADRIVHHLNNDEFAVWNAPAIDKGRNALRSAEAAPTPLNVWATAGGHASPEPLRDELLTTDIVEVINGTLTPHIHNKHARTPHTHAQVCTHFTRRTCAPYSSCPTIGSKKLSVYWGHNETKSLAFGRWKCKDRW